MVHRQGSGHEAAPDVRGHCPTADSAKRLVVVATDPHSDDQIAREADEQGIAIFLGRSGLAEGRNGKRRAASRAVVGCGIEEVEHGRPVAAPIKRAV